MAKSKYYSNVEPKLDLIKQWARRGYTDKDICVNLKVSESSFYEYKKKHPELVEALAIGKEQANAMVENQALKNSLGFTYVEEVVSTKKEVLYENGKRLKEISEPVIMTLKKYKPSDQTAVKYWLNNQDSENWKEKQDINLGGQKDNPLIMKLEDVL